MNRTNTEQLSFGMGEVLGILDNLDENMSQLTKIDKLIDWEPIKRKLRDIHSNLADDRGGERPYNPLAMFKAIFLGQWYSLSDEQLRQGLNLRLDFIGFCRFNIGQVPDRSTLCRFRSLLVKKNILEDLFDIVNKQLEAHNLKLKKSTVVIDATIVQSLAKPNKVIEVSTTQNDDDSTPDSNPVQKSADKDATWLKKGNKSHFGYRAHVAVDEEGMILAAHTTPANESENPNFKKVVDKAKLDNQNTSSVLTDKGYACESNEKFLADKKIESGIMHKAKKNKPLTHEQKKENKAISKKRYVVEQTFGTIKRKFKMFTASYFTTARVHAQFLLKAICCNLLKAVNKIIRINRIATLKF